METERRQICRVKNVHQPLRFEGRSFSQGLHLDCEHRLRAAAPDRHHAAVYVPDRASDAGRAHGAHVHLGAGAEQEEEEQEHHAHANR